MCLCFIYSGPMRRSLFDPFVLCFYDYYMGWISVLYLVNVILASWESGFDYCGLFLFNLQIPIDHVDTAIKYWIMKTSGRLSCHPTCTACDAVVTASEQSRAERGHLCAHASRAKESVCVWPSVRGCERERTAVNVCVFTRGWTRRDVSSCDKPQLLRETSAVTAR